MDAAHNLMCALRDRIALEEALADELVLIADMLPAAGGVDFAGGLRMIVRHHRARAIEMRSQLVALRDRDGDARSQG